MQTYMRADTLYGMSRFSRWYQGTKQMSDMDGLVHNAANNNMVILEFKPAGKQLSTGQTITLEGFSRKEGCSGVVVFDPLWNDTTEDPYEPDMLLRCVIFVDGKQTVHYMSVVELSSVIDALLGIMVT